MKKVKVNDLFQTDYEYVLTEPIGRNFAKDFKPDLTPEEMLRLGVFGGKYMTDRRSEFPKSWFAKAKLCHSEHRAELNYFKVNASQPLSVWQEKGWIYPEDPRGWFQWYCRYYMGRRILQEDERQIRRWKNMTRHLRQLQLNCRGRGNTCRPRQRQALLHWAYDTRNI